jgi:hypothetical protein
MDRRDQELLDKQLRRVTPAPRNDGIMILAIVAVFFAGMTVGSFLVDEGAPTRVASNDTASAVAPAGAPFASRPSYSSGSVVK